MALTPPGTTLKAGQTAIVEFDTTLANGNNGPSYKLRLTIDSITAGSMSDFSGISLTGVPKGSSPTYVRLGMTNLSAHAINTTNDDPADSIGAIQADGNLDSSLILTGYFPHCPDVSTPSTFASGQSFTTCETFMEKGEATKIGYDGSSATLSDPIMWTP
jgi:hypothetical protein